MPELDGTGLPTSGLEDGGLTPPVGNAEGDPGGGSEPFVEIDGKSYPLSEVKRWKDTRPNLEKYYYNKMNEVDAKAKEVDNAVRLYQWVAEHPEVSQKLIELADQGELPPQKASEGDDEYLARLERIEKTMTGMANKFEEQEKRRIQREADDNLAREIGKLKEKFGKDKILPFNEEQVLLEAVNSGSTDLEMVYKKMRNDAFDPDRFEQDAIQRYVTQKKTSNPPMPQAGAGAAAGLIPGGSTREVKSFADARRSALQRLQGRREGE